MAGDRDSAPTDEGRFAPDLDRAQAPTGSVFEAKTLSASERDEDARATWRERMAGVDPVDLVFVDECGTHTSMTRRRARTRRGARAHGRVPRNRGRVTTLITAVSLRGMAPAMTIEGGTSAPVFATYLQHLLVPSLRPGQVVVLDNVGAHKPARMRALVEAAGCQLVFLPAYSLDFSPVEEAISKIKALLRAAAARTRGALDAAIAAALDAVTPTDATGWFTDRGHPPQPTR